MDADFDSGRKFEGLTIQALGLAWGGIFEILEPGTQAAGIFAVCRKKKMPFALRRGRLVPGAEPPSRPPFPGVYYPTFKWALCLLRVSSS